MGIDAVVIAGFVLIAFVVAVIACRPSTAGPVSQVLGSLTQLVASLTPWGALKAIGQGDADGPRSQPSQQGPLTDPAVSAVGDDQMDTSASSSKISN